MKRGAFFTMLVLGIGLSLAGTFHATALSAQVVTAKDLGSCTSPADEASVQQLAGQLRNLDGRVIVLGKVRQQPLESMLARDVQARLRMANQAETRVWEKVRT